MKSNGFKSKLNSLPPAQREQLIRWLCVEEISYKCALLRLKKEFGVSSSTGALSKFWQRVASPSMEQRRTLKNTFLEIRVRIRRGEKLIGETEFNVALGDISPKGEVSFETTVQTLTPEIKNR
jgi:hypothetical protein